jgi:hypothetical protein
MLKKIINVKMSGINVTKPCEPVTQISYTGGVLAPQIRFFRQRWRFPVVCPFPRPHFPLTIFYVVHSFWQQFLMGIKKR